MYADQNPTRASDLLLKWLEYEKLNAHAVETHGRINGGRACRWLRTGRGWSLTSIDSSNAELNDDAIDAIVRAIESKRFVISAFDIGMAVTTTLFGTSQGFSREEEIEKHDFNFS